MAEKKETKKEDKFQVKIFGYKQGIWAEYIDPGAGDIKVTNENGKNVVSFEFNPLHGKIRIVLVDGE